MRFGRHKMPWNKDKGSVGILRMGAATSGSSAAGLRFSHLRLGSRLRILDTVWAAVVGHQQSNAN